MCDNNITIDSDTNFSCWENKKTTKDEKEIILYLQNNLELLKNKTILHVGIGNSELGLTFSKYAKFIDGITISIPEKNKGISNNCYRNINICNKYNLNDMKNIFLNKYDIIIDQGLKCYSCCNTHFVDLFEFYIQNLSNKGIFITSKFGMNWSGYDIKKSIELNMTNRICHKTNNNDCNKLSLNELMENSKKFNLTYKQNKNIIFLYN